MQRRTGALSKRRHWAVPRRGERCAAACKQPANRRHYTAPYVARIPEHPVTIALRRMACSNRAPCRLWHGAATEAPPRAHISACLTFLQSILLIQHNPRMRILALLFTSLQTLYTLHC